MTAVSSRDAINRIKGTTVTPGVCIVCPWHCPTEVYCRAGEVVYVRGNECSPNQGARCVKGAASIHLARDPNRLQHPLKKNSTGGFDRISWEDAFALIAEKLQRIKDTDGPEAVVFLWHLDSNVLFPFQLFSQLYGTPNCSGHAAACDQDRRLASLSVYGHPMPTRDFALSRFMMLWGYDPLGANESLHESRGLMEALERNARLIVVDPIRSATAEKASRWLPIKPGTDGALALAIAHRIMETESYDRAFCEQWLYGFEEFGEHLVAKEYTPAWAEAITGISRRTIIEVADEFAATKPALMDGFKGLVNYSTGLDAFRTIFTLNALTGNVDGPGNLILKEQSPLGLPCDIPVEAIAAPRRPVLSEGMGYPLAPDIPTQLLPRAVLEQEPYAVKAAFFHITNPLMSEPNTSRYRQMLRQLELSVAIDLYLSETAQECDLVLPEASFYERAEVREGLWSGPQVIVSQPAIAPRGESKPLYEIIKGIAGALGYGRYFQWDSWQEWARRMTKDLPISFAELTERGCWQGELRYHKFVEEGFQTMTGQIEVLSERFQLQGYGGLPVFTEGSRVMPDQEYPFQLTNNKMRFHCNLHTQHNPYLLQLEDENWAELNPLDAARYGVMEGDRIEVASPLDRVVIRARLSENVRPGVLRVIHGHGFGRSAGVLSRGKGAHVNPIIGTNVNPVSGGIGYNECTVRLKKV